MRLRRSLDEFIVDGVDTTLPLFRTLVRNATCRTACTTSTGSNISSRPAASSRIFKPSRHDNRGGALAT